MSARLGRRGVLLAAVGGLLGWRRRPTAIRPADEAPFEPLTFQSDAMKGQSTMGAERLAELKLQLPTPVKPSGVYKPLVIVGNIAYCSGHLPIKPDGTMATGKVGADATQQQGNDAARLSALSILATLRSSLGSLDRVVRVVKVLGLVNCTPDFTQQPAVINGCSEILSSVFGPDAGVGAHSAVGAVSLPLGSTVEVEAIFEIKP